MHPPEQSGKRDSPIPLTTPSVRDAFIPRGKPRGISATISIKADLDKGIYPKGIKVSDEEMSRLSIEHADFHGEWNYFIKPLK